ncbi:hypothetical protein Ddye_004719 [Dipteronia dyeriana]|uniref:Uncharacterized protein n=1 Tax=Dipteronia dyeriana TaxID=168575 RepID=A0AAD9XEU1_9ROSI|nr:hypothetical protein Ddye_004719 [Dipteronia dyeriana]
MEIFEASQFTPIAQMNQMAAIQISSGALQDKFMRLSIKMSVFSCCRSWTHRDLSSNQAKGTFKNRRPMLGCSVVRLTPIFCHRCRSEAFPCKITSMRRKCKKVLQGYCFCSLVKGTRHVKPFNLYPCVWQSGSGTCNKKFMDLPGRFINGKADAVLGNRDTR